MGKHKSEDYKVSAVKHYLLKTRTQEEVCEIFGCSVRSLMRWVDRYKDEGGVPRHNREPIAYRVKKEHVEFLKNEVGKQRTITMENLTIKLQEKFPELKISLYHVWRTLINNNISLKLRRVRHEPVKRYGKDVNIHNQLKEFYTIISQYDLDEFICIDETSISALQKRNHCYSNVGKRCVIKTQSQDVFKKYTAIFAISINGVIGWELYEKGGIDSERLMEFLQKYITNRYKNKVIIMDNASSHRNENVKKLASVKNKLYYSIPYQHYTNAIENFFSILKSKLEKMEGYKYEELKENIQKAIDKIPNSTYKNILRGSYKREEEWEAPERKHRKYKNKKYK